MPYHPPKFSDYILALSYCVALYAVVLAVGGPLTMHEGVLSQTSRQMAADHDWIVPHYDEAPWLERPPLPQWITIAITRLVGRDDVEWAFRVGPALSGTLAVLLTVWLGGAFYGRKLGVLSGLILATMYQFVRYSTLAEADMFLCPIVTSCLTMFAYLEIIRTRGDKESRLFPGTRPWPVLAFFLLLGMTNLAKGIVFGTAMCLVPIGVFLLWNAGMNAMLRYVWLWGWLAFAAVALAWPVAVYLQHPDVVELWRSDLFGRLLPQDAVAQTKIIGTANAEPIWYYLANWFWVVAPWPLLAVAGLKVTASAAFMQRNSAQRFLWCWALVTPLAFSLAHGKHHHYMLHFLPPWGILAALGSAWAWRRIQTMPLWFPLPPARTAMAGVFLLLLVLNWVSFNFKGGHLHRSSGDTAFLRKVMDVVPAKKSLLLHPGEERLEGLRMLFYCHDGTHVLHNLTFLRDARLSSGEAFLIARGKDMPSIAQFGQVTQIFQSENTRREQSPADRWTLFHVQMGDKLVHLPAPLRISPIQAMYRVDGPWLE